MVNIEWTTRDEEEIEKDDEIYRAAVGGERILSTFSVSICHYFGSCVSSYLPPSCMTSIIPMANDFHAKRQDSRSPESRNVR